MILQSICRQTDLHCRQDNDDVGERADDNGEVVFPELAVGVVAAVAAAGGGAECPAVER